MSRSGYSDEIEDNWRHIMYRGRVASATRGKRGQRLLRELLAALDAMPDKRLIADELQADGEFCALGVLGAAKGMDMAKLDPTDPEQVAAAFDIAEPLAREIVYENDESFEEYEYVDVEICGPVRRHHPDWGSHKKTVRIEKKGVAERRWHHMRNWIASQITETTT